MNTQFNFCCGCLHFNNLDSRCRIGAIDHKIHYDTDASNCNYYKDRVQFIEKRN